MNSMLDAVLRSWPFEPWLYVTLLLTGGIYLRGWLILQRRDAWRWSQIQLSAFLAGLAVLFLALASPIEPFTSLLLQVHMVQHMMIMMLVPPLLWLGAPQFPLLLGLPRPLRSYWAAPLLRSHILRRTFEFLTHPVAAWLLFTAATWFWHAPPIYELALRSAGWHYLQHICFLVTALLFWYPVIRPYPCRPNWSLWLLIPYLFLADIQNTLLSALLTFADRPLYAHYIEGPRLGNLSPLDDQATAGVLMWVPGSLAYLVPLCVIGIRLLYGGDDRKTRRPASSSGRIRSLEASPSWPALPILGQARPLAEHSDLDLLKLPLIGRFLLWRHSRLSLQIPLLLAAGLIIYDGFRGPQVGAMNLAGVVPWIHWRGLIVVGMLVAGNVFCMACPFPGASNTGKALASSRPILASLAAQQVAGDFSTDCISVGLRGVRTLGQPVADRLDRPGVFRGGLRDRRLFSRRRVLQVRVPDRPVQLRAIVDFTASSEGAQPGRLHRAGRKTASAAARDSGCELHLYQPRKSGNMDCTFCLDCIHACPHDNVGILAETPGTLLWHDAFRSGLGRFSKRTDLAALVVVLAFGTFVNAAGMTALVLEWQDRLTSLMRQQSPLLATTLFSIFGLIVLPLVVVGTATA